MPDLIHLEWERATAGYSVERLTTESDFRRYDVPDDMMQLSLSEQYQADPLFIVPKGKTKEQYEPLAGQFRGLFRQFADLDNSPEAVVEFATAFGFLGIFRKSDETIPFIEPVWEWYDFINFMKQSVATWMAAKEAGDLTPIIEKVNRRKGPQIWVRLYRGADSSRAALRIQPPSLWHGIRLQFAQAVADNMELKKCAYCPRWFPVGTGTGRRKSADHCSSQCQKAHWAVRQKEKNQ